MIKLVISGGQTGADIAGLLAAKHCNIKTFGFVPPGYFNESGNDNSLADIFGLVELEINPKFTTSDYYRERTKQNIHFSDGTVIFATDLNSPGTILTINTCKMLNNPFIINPTKLQLLDFITINEIKDLNIAGNRESKSPGIQDSTTTFLIDVFSETNPPKPSLKTPPLGEPAIGVPCPNCENLDTEIFRQFNNTIGNYSQMGKYFNFTHTCPKCKTVWFQSIIILKEHFNKCRSCDSLDTYPLYPNNTVWKCASCNNEWSP
ncbi:putative molybdenum carrier protein [Bacteroides sp.]|uniref:YpsA SLOG family protein n=1 Tax=Bacteroides sp. TaxID=29523 RepID=UPI00260612C6|nr:putative molybdenum carrier protein [Bacteroides sp.]MDD3039058.1 putative molybdenum carrier protein [Bacteroides sp.]